MKATRFELIQRSLEVVSPLGHLPVQLSAPWLGRGQSRARRRGRRALRRRMGIGPGQAVVLPGEAATLEGLGVHAAGICVQGGAASLTAPARLRPFAALAARLGAPHVRVFAPGFRDRRQARKGLEAGAKIADEHGITLLVETAPETIAPSTAQARALVDGFPPDRVGVLYDPGNMVLRHVHVKNVSWRERGAWTWRHAPLADGLINWRAVIEALEDAGYAGRLS